jgi:hypothetical protein
MDSDRLTAQTTAKLRPATPPTAEAESKILVAPFVHWGKPFHEFA